MWKCMKYDGKDVKPRPCRGSATCRTGEAPPRLNPAAVRGRQAFQVSVIGKIWFRIDVDTNGSNIFEHGNKVCHHPASPPRLRAQIPSPTCAE